MWADEALPVRCWMMGNYLVMDLLSRPAVFRYSLSVVVGEGWGGGDSDGGRRRGHQPPIESFRNLPPRLLSRLVPGSLIAFVFGAGASSVRCPRCCCSSARPRPYPSLHLSPLSTHTHTHTLSLSSLSRPRDAHSAESRGAQQTAPFPAHRTRAGEERGERERVSERH